jgi:hypothetical protein
LHHNYFYRKPFECFANERDFNNLDVGENTNMGGVVDEKHQHGQKTKE